jgi:tetratricopeptide (TPR) repeat protein
MAVGGVCFTLQTTPNGKYWPYLDDLQKRAEAGCPFTQKMVESMHYFEEGLKNLKLIAEATGPLENFQRIQEQCVRRIADCYKTEPMVAYYQPPELLDVLKEVCEATMTEERSDLDLAARICYCCTLASFETSITDALIFCKVSHKKYPSELYFYVAYMRALTVTGNREAAMKICLKGLKQFPNSAQLLFRKAENIAAAGSPSTGEIILAWKEFVEKVPYDHPDLPHSHYVLCALVSSLHGGDEEARTLYTKGLELEEKLLPCFSPVRPEIKMVTESASVYCLPRLTKVLCIHSMAG